METNWGKKIGILAGTVSLLMLGGFILFAPQQSLAEACQPGTHPDPGGLGCLPDTSSCGVGQHQEGSGCVDDEPWSPDTMSCPAGQHQEGSACVANAPAGSGIAASPQPPAEPQDIDCGGWLSPDLNCVIGRLFYYTVYSTFGFLVWVAATFLDLVIKLTILDFHNWAALPGIKIAWTVLRDTMNITFIFLLLYASISMILGLGKEKGIVKGVIMAGLLINFSFFFTSVIIDASNVLTVQMHSAVQKIGNNISANENSVVGTQSGITAVFMQGAGIQVAAIKDLDAASFVATLLQQMIFSSILFLVLAFVFFAMGFLLLGRFIVLIILLITSPISVMGGLFPQIAGYSKKWWKALIDQAVFPPLMMLFLVVTAVIVSNQEFRGKFSQENVPGLVGGVDGLVQYAIVIGLLIVGMVIAKSSAGAASNGAADWAIKKARGVPGAFGGAAAGWLGRNTVGRFAKGAGESYDLRMGQMSQLTFKDAKGITGVAKFAAGRTIAGIARITPIDEGIRDTLKATAASKFGSQESLAEREKARIQRTKELGQAVKDAKTATTIAAGLKYTTEGLRNGSYKSSEDKAKNYIETVAKITDQQIEEMLATEKLDQLKKMAPDLTSKHMDKIMSSTLISDTVKGDIGGARKSGLLDRVTTGKVANVYNEAKKITSGKPHEVAQLPSDVLSNKDISAQLSVGTLSKIALDGKVGEADKAIIRANIEAAQNDLTALTRPWTAEEQALADNTYKTLGWLNSDAGQIF